MRRTALLVACLLAVTPVLAQQSTVPNPLGDTSDAAAAPASPGGGATTSSMPPGSSVAATRATPTASVTGANDFATEAAAEAHCPGDTVVWENPRSKAYHLKGDRYFGHTKTGAYMCRRDADAAGKHASGTRKGGGGRKPAHPART